MARTSNPNSATSQFFINVKSNPSAQLPALNGPGYAVFGKVVAGTGGGRQDPRRWPPATKTPWATCRLAPVVIKSATVVQVNTPRTHSPQGISMSNAVSRYELHTNHSASSRIELDADKAPKSVANFLAYVHEGPLRQHGVPPRDLRLHDPGRRFRARHEAEAPPTRRSRTKPATA